MSTSRVLAILPVLFALFAGLQTADANVNARLPHAPDAFKLADPASRGYSAVTQHGEHVAQQSGQQVIPPSMALRLALSYSPGSQGLGVDLVQGRRLMYAVKLKTGNRVHRVLVDARTGQILGE